MANDKELYFHGTSAAGATFTPAQSTTYGPTIDLGSNGVNRVIVVERRILSRLVGTGSIDTVFQDSTDGTFTNMPGATGALIGFARGNTTSYASTDAVAADAPHRITIRTDKRYIRAGVSVTETTTSYGGVSIVGKVMSGAWSGASGVRDT